MHDPMHGSAAAHVLCCHLRVLQTVDMPPRRRRRDRLTVAPRTSRAARADACAAAASCGTLGRRTSTRETRGARRVGAQISGWFSLLRLGNYSRGGRINSSPRGMPANKRAEHLVSVDALWRTAVGGGATAGRAEAEAPSACGVCAARGEVPRARAQLAGVRFVPRLFAASRRGSRSRRARPGCSGAATRTRA